MGAITEANFIKFICNLFPSTPVYCHSGSQTILMWIPAKNKDGVRLVHWLQAASGLPGAGTGYKRVDPGAGQTLTLSYASRTGRTSVATPGNLPPLPTGGTTGALTGGYSTRYWYIPVDSFSDATWIAYITAINAGTASPLSPYSGRFRKDIQAVTHLNDFSESVWQY